MQSCRALSTPSEVNPEHLEEGALLDSERHQCFRSILGKEIWTIPERPDTAFTVKELSCLLSKHQRAGLDAREALAQVPARHAYSLPAIGRRLLAAE
eukprot:15791558-Heterocapsa_arctica.AAC.1